MVDFLTLIGATPAWRKRFHPKYTDLSFSLKAAIAEFFAMSLFVYFGCASAVFLGAESVVGGGRVATNQWTLDTTVNTLTNAAVGDTLKAMQLAGSWGITVALTFGLGISVVVYCTAHVSGGQVNPVVSTCLFLTGHLGLAQCIGNIIAQYVGAILGAAFLYGTVPNANASSLGSNSVSPFFTNQQALCGEILMTCLLVFTVLQTCCEPRCIAKNAAPLAIGLSVFCAHCVLLPVDGCSINPARSFGPAVLAGSFSNFWVFNAGPWLGGLVGIFCHLLLWLDWDEPIANLGKKVRSNGVSNDNSGLQRR